MDRRTEITIFLNFLFLNWIANPHLTFCQLLEYCCGSAIVNDDQRMMEIMAERTAGNTGRKPEPRSTNTPPPLPTDWTIVRSILVRAMDTYGFPPAELKKDYNGVQYYDEGYRFDENNDRLILDYVPGLDLSVEAQERIRFRQNICNTVMDRVLRAAMGG